MLDGVLPTHTPVVAAASVILFSRVCVPMWRLRIVWTIGAVFEPNTALLFPHLELCVNLFVLLSRLFLFVFLLQFVASFTVVQLAMYVSLRRFFLFLFHPHHFSLLHRFFFPEFCLFSSCVIRWSLYFQFCFETNWLCTGVLSGLLVEFECMRCVHSFNNTSNIQCGW